MKKAYKVIVKTNQGAEKSITHDVPDAGSWWGALKIKALPGARYQLIDSATGQGPDNIRVKRVGNDLRVSFEGRDDADLVISNYYEQTAPGFAALVGETAPGEYYPYIPESGETAALVGNLSDGVANVGMALGGEPVVGTGAAVGALVGAATVNPLLAAPLALVGAAAGGGGGGGGGVQPDTTPPNISAARLAPEDDTGVNNSDGITSDNTPSLLVDADADATEAKVTLNGKTYTSTTKNAQGQFVVQVPEADVLGNGVHAFTVVVKDAAGNASLPFEGTLTVDRSSDQNYLPTAVNDVNTGTTLQIASISTDSGFSQQDFITSDHTLSFMGTLTGYTATGQNFVELHLTNSAGTVVASHYVEPVNATGAWRWTWDNGSQTLPDGLYQLTSQLVDKAGNAVGAAATPQSITIDSNVNPDANAGFSVAITQLVQDSGVSNNDFLTKETHLSFIGNVSTPREGFSGKVLVQIVGTDGLIKSQSYVDPNANGAWTYDNTAQTLGVLGRNTQYVLKASVVDLAGNVLKSTDQSFTVDLKPSEFNVEGGELNSNSLGMFFDHMELSADEAGSFTYSNNVPVGQSSITAFDAGTFSISYTDLAGNISTISNLSRWEFQLSTAIMESKPTTSSFPSTFGSGELAGLVGSYVLSANETNLDLSALHSTSPNVGTVGAISHVGLSGSGTVVNANHTLSLTSSDVLVLGVKNSVVSDGRQQMRIDGDAGDTVLLNDLVGASTYAWETAVNPVLLSGHNYTLYTNSALGLDVFVQQAVHVTLL